MKQKLSIPSDWTFRTRNVAENFDVHVREQLPWYDLATSAVVHIARHYVYSGSVVYDIGASTGNVSLAIWNAMSARSPKIHAIEQSEEMIDIMAARFAALDAPIEIVHGDAIEADYKSASLIVCFLTVMFLPVGRRAPFLDRLYTTVLAPGGALVVVDKLETPEGYIGSIIRRLTMSWKLSSGTTPEDIVRKELSLAGYQRPINERLMDGGHRFFQLGEFAGWVFEKPETR